MSNMGIDYKQFRIDVAPPNVFYIPNFINEDEETNIKTNVYNVPKPKWTCLSNRRLQDYGGIPHKNGMITEPIPSWLITYLLKIEDLCIFENSLNPNHVLVNEYLPGQGILPHSDGPLFTPIICTINCLSHTVLEFHENDEQRNKVCKLLLEPRSLVIIKDDLYNHYLHSISNQTYDIVEENISNLKNCFVKYEAGQCIHRNTRVSLTIRNVPKVTKFTLRR